MRNLAQGSSDDRYEWLSAYIDDELAPPDRQRVEHWLATDPAYQASYRRLMKMRQGFQGLRDQELANLTPLPIHQILKASPQVAAGFRAASPDLQPWGKDGRKHQGKRSLLTLASVGGFGLAACWVMGLGSPWAEPVTRVQSPETPEIAETSLARVPSPLITPNTSLQLSKSLPAPAPVAPSSQASSSLTSSKGSGEENPEASGLTFALDQPLVAFPADHSSKSLGN